MWYEWTESHILEWDGVLINSLIIVIVTIDLLIYLINWFIEINWFIDLMI